MRRLLLTVLTIGLIGGCDRIINGPDDIPLPQAGLKAFADQNEFKDYVAGQVAERNSLYVELAVDTRDETTDQLPGTSTGEDLSNGEAGGAPVASPEAGGTDAADGDHSQTTIQEEGVDEADVVKTDGSYIYMLVDNALRIVQVTPRDALGEVGSVPLEGWGRNLYLAGGRVVALTETYGGYYVDGPVLGADGAEGDVPDGEPAVVEPAESGSTEGEPGKEEPAAEEGSDGETAEGSDGATEPDAGDADGDDASDTDGDEEPILIAPAPDFFGGPRTVVTIIDVTNPAAPQVVSKTTFDGWSASSRMIDGRLHLVLANYPDYYYYGMIPLWGSAELDATQVDPELLLPTYTHTAADGTTTEGQVITWQQLYRPEEPDGFGIVTVVSLDSAGDGSSFDAAGVMTDPALIYSSTEALYLTDSGWDYLGDERQTTSIYKLAYSAGAAVPVAAGAVPGRILNQYSMSEYQGYLRVATTVDARWFFFNNQTEPYNNVYVLAAAGNALSIVGKIENLAEGETIQSARFLGARGFLVTFEQVDPLFTLDLADPANPRVVGQLKVPGFSTFMLPMDENHLFAIGQYVPEDGSWWSSGVQVSIFDVTDFANPVRTHNVILGSSEESTYSEALWDPKALTYFVPQGEQDALVAFPISIHDNGEWFIDVDPGVITVPDDGTGDGATGSEGSDGSEVDASGGEAVPPADEVSEPFVPEGFEGLMVYRVSATGGFTELGRISTRFDATGYWWTSFTRGVFIGSDVFAVTNLGVRGGAVSTLATPAYELALPMTVDAGTEPR
ncbi:MAG TPA: beta-propeller domain-containing protein [Phycisphaerae bacterium]|nr:beta-propeller domain-containing protein [Phycisphaerae bacterium]HNU47161.1 beta-propeller domain-containing protein [Phycisphaerae bacterium]